MLLKASVLFIPAKESQLTLLFMARAKNLEGVVGPRIPPTSWDSAKLVKLPNSLEPSLSFSYPSTFACAYSAVSTGHGKKYSSLRQLLLDEILKHIPKGYHHQIRTNGHPKRRLPNTLSISFQHLGGSLLQAALGDRVAVSSGAACHSESAQLSHVLSALNVEPSYGVGTLRISVGFFTTKEDCVKAAEIIGDLVSQCYEDLKLGKTNKLTSKL